MNVLIWVIVAILVLVVVMISVGRRVLGGIDPTQLLLDPELVGRVRALALANQKIPAIKMLRDGTPGLGLASAKQMVDRMAAPPRTVAAAPAGAAEMTPSGSDVPLEVELQARSMKSAGQDLPAINLVREHTSWGLREAKDYVDGL